MIQARPTLYWRQLTKHGERWAYADLRALGCGRVALGTNDAEEAAVRFGERVATARTARERIDAETARRTALGIPLSDASVTPGTFEAFASHHLVEKAKAGKVTDQHLAADERHLERAQLHFGASSPLRDIKPQHVVAWIHSLSALTVPRGKGTTTLHESSIRRHLHSLANMLQRAVAEEVIPANPARMLLSEQRPSGQSRAVTRHFDGWEVAAILEAARSVTWKRADLACPFAFELLATLALTGARPDEAFGLTIADVQLPTVRDGKEHADGLIQIRPNRWRRLKTPKSTRSVRMWPQLAAILRPYLDRRFLAGAPAPDALLFVSPKTGEKLDDGRSLLDAVAGRLGWADRSIRARMFRPSYATARLMTLEHGAPVSLWTVSGELGHGSLAMLEQRYGRIDRSAIHADVVRFDWHDYATEPKAARLYRRLGLLGDVGTSAEESADTFSTVLS